MHAGLSVSRLARLLLQHGKRVQHPHRRRRKNVCSWHLPSLGWKSTQKQCGVGKLTCFKISGYVDTQHAGTHACVPLTDNCGTSQSSQFHCPEHRVTIISYMEGNWNSCAFLKCHLIQDKKPQQDSEAERDCAAKSYNPQNVLLPLRVKFTIVASYIICLPVFAHSFQSANIHFSFENRQRQSS